MSYRRSGNSGIQLPAISLGLWQNFGSGDPFDTARAMVLRAFDLGITHIESLCNLEALLGAGAFTFIGLPMKWRDGTGSPIRAVAVFGM